MSLVKSIARRLARGLARRAGRSELFEKPGERGVTEPLLAPAGSEAASAGSATRLVAPGALRDALRPRGRPLVIHHWATWCAPCAEELPRIERLAVELAGVADVVGLSWELFDTPHGPAGAVEAVRASAEALGLSWPSLVFDGAPEALFSALEMDSKTIPQTRVIGADGACLEEFTRPLTAADLGRVRALLGA